MMFLTIALIGQAHGFEPLLTGQLEAQGISCLAMPGLDASLEERATLAIIADTPPRARAIDVLHVLRRRSDLPCIIVLPRGHRDIDRILTLEAGADDWIDQGARMRELLAHIRAVLRRQRGLGSTPAPPARMAGSFAPAGANCSMPLACPAVSPPPSSNCCGCWSWPMAAPCRARSCAAGSSAAIITRRTARWTIWSSAFAARWKPTRATRSGSDRRGRWAISSRASRLPGR